MMVLTPIRSLLPPPPRVRTWSIHRWNSSLYVRGITNRTETGCLNRCFLIATVQLLRASPGLVSLLLRESKVGPAGTCLPLCAPTCDGDICIHARCPQLMWNNSPDDHLETIAPHKKYVSMLRVHRASRHTRACSVTGSLPRTSYSILRSRYCWCCGRRRHRCTRLRATPRRRASLPCNLHKLPTLVGLINWSC